MSPLLNPLSMQAGPLPFKPQATGEAPTQHPALPELIRWGRLFHEKGWTPPCKEGFPGNLSVRTEQGCLISATQAPLGALEEDLFVEIVECDLHTQPPTVRYRGAREPSTDSLVHWTLYQLKPEIQSILHAHDPKVLEAAERLKLPQTEREVAPGCAELLKLIEPLAEQSYFLMKGHGFVATGATVEEAGQRVLSIRQRAEAL